MGHVKNAARGRRGAGKRNKNQRQPERRRLAEQNVRSAMDQVGDRDESLVAFKRKARTHSMGYDRAGHESDARESPNNSDPRAAAMEDLFTEQTKKNLRGPATGRPS